MARPRNGKPWLRKSDNCYYTTVGRKAVKIGKLGDSREKIQQAYHAVLAGLQRPSEPTVQRIIRDFLDYCQRDKAASTYEWYREFLDAFTAFLPAHVLPEQLKPSTVSKWIEKQYGECKPSTRHAAARTITRAMNWAVKERLIERSPLVGFTKPAASSREAVITPAQYRNCLRHAKGAMKDAVEFLFHTGCRPQEFRVIEAEWWDDDKIVLPRDKSKGKKKRRVIYLDDRAREIMKVWACDFPIGPMFRNHRDEPWTKDSLNCAFRRLKAKSEIPSLCAYSLRHTRITELLKSGVDVATVAALMGNSPRMILDVYQHVARDETHLLSALKGATH